MKYYVFQKRGKFYEPTCRIIEANTAQTDDVFKAFQEAHPRIATRALQITVDFDDNRYVEDYSTGEELYKLTPYVEGRSYVRHEDA